MPEDTAPSSPDQADAITVVGEPRNHEQFLKAIFHSLPDGAQAALVAPYTPPGETKPVFPANAWPSFKISPFATHYSIASFKATPNERRIRRKGEDWRAAHLLMLDDVGEQKPEGVKKTPDVEPSFIIETKPGSAQWGYIFAQPVTDPEWVNRLLHATIDAGITDRSGNIISRLCRLPGTKPPDKQHTSKLTHWSNILFDPEELVAALGLNLAAVDVVQPGSWRRGIFIGHDDKVSTELAQSMAQIINGDHVHTPTNKIAHMLAHGGLVGAKGIATVLQAILKLGLWQAGDSHPRRGDLERFLSQSEEQALFHRDHAVSRFNTDMVMRALERLPMKGPLDAREAEAAAELAAEIILKRRNKNYG